jgi:hypothetical protein
MPDSLTIFELTQEHIEHGVRGQCERCPLALCMSQKMGKPIMTDGEYAWPRNDNRQGTLLKLPRFCTQWVEKFDYTGAKGVEPFSFSLDTRFWDEEE